MLSRITNFVTTDNTIGDGDNQIEPPHHTNNQLKASAFATTKHR